MKKLNRSSKKTRSSLRVEALEQRQLLAGISGGGTEVLTNLVHSNGNVYDQVQMNGSAVTVTADAGQITRVSFLDLSGDIVQVEFSGKGSLTISLDADTYKGPAEATTYNQPGVEYVQGLASFSISGSDASTNFSVWTVGKDTAHGKADSSLFATGLSGGDHDADVQRLIIVADPANANGSLFGGIRMANTTFSGSSGVVGISAANVQVQDVVRIGDIDASGSATPTLVFGDKSQFVSVDVAGGDLAQTNNKAISNVGSYKYVATFTAGKDSAGTELVAQANKGSFSDFDPTKADSKTYTLTAAIDTIVGSGGDDTINASHTDSTAVVSALDKVDGGAGNDALLINDSASSKAQLDGLTVTNVETFVYNSTGKLGATDSVDLSGWTGLTAATVVLQNTAAATSSIELGAATALTLTTTSTGTPGLWTVTGGKTVTVTSTGANLTNGTTVTGVDGTTAVTVTQSTSGTQGKVTVTDWATGSDDGETGTIASVTVKGADDVEVNSNALATLTLTDVTGTVDIKDELADHADAGTSLTLNANEITVTLDDNNDTVKSLAIVTSGDKSTVTVTDFGQLETLTVSGTKNVTLGDLDAEAAGLKTLTVSGTAGVSATVDQTVAVTAADGADTITLAGAAKAAVSTGAGNDVVVAPLKSNKTLDGGSIDGGEGTDTITLTGADAVGATTEETLAGTISGFEVLKIAGSGSAGTVDFKNMDGINNVELAVSMGGAYTLDNMASGAAVTISASQGGTGTIDVPVSAIQNETLALKLTSDTSDVDAATLVTGSISTVNLSVSDTKSGAAAATYTVALPDAKTVNVSGDALKVVLTTEDATTINASGVTEGTFDLTINASTESVTVTGSSKANDIDASLAGDKLVITTGSAADTITLSGNSATITAGDGNNVIDDNGAAGTDSVTITTGKGNDTIDLSNTAGTNTIVAGDGNDSITVTGSAISNITLGGGTDQVIVSGAAGKSGYFVSITGAGDGDIIDLSAAGNGTAVLKGASAANAQITLGQGSSFTDYVTAATTGNAAAATNSVISWFQFGGDTYIVLDGTNADGFNAAEDQIVRLTGTINLGSGTTAISTTLAGRITI